MSSYMTPPLTTIRKDKMQLGKAAARLLLQKIESGMTNTENRMIEVKHIIRSSCAAVKE